MAKKKKDQKKILIEEEKNILKDEEPLLEDEDEDEIEEIGDEGEKEDKSEDGVVDLAEVENDVVEDEDGVITVDLSHRGGEEEEVVEFIEDNSEDEDEEKTDNIEKVKVVGEVGGEIQVSKTEFERVVNRLEILKTTSRKEVAEKLRTARGFGDLSENAEYEAAKKDQAFVEGEISDLEQRLERMVVIDLFGLSDEVVHIGNIAKIERMRDKKVINCLIVGSSYESDIGCEPLKIARDSPVGGSILGMAMGQTVKVKLPHNKTEIFKVLDISH
jgi:transcription elongation factor GreA